MQLTIGLGVNSIVSNLLDSIEERGEDRSEGQKISLQLGTLIKELVKHWQTGLSDRFRILSAQGSCVYFTLHSDTILIKISELFGVWRSSISKLGSVLNNYQV